MILKESVARGRQLHVIKPSIFLRKPRKIVKIVSV